MNPATWMADPNVQAKTVSQVVFPGTHDSATFSLQAALSQIKYDNIAFLWALNPGQAPAGFPGGDTNYVGAYAYDFIMDLVLSTSTSQDQDLTAQLLGGIRFFDLRVYWDTTNSDVYIQHGLIGASLATLLQQVATYLQQQPDGREVILLQLSHSNFSSYPEATTRVMQLVSETIGLPAVYCPVDGKSFAGTALVDIAGNGSRCVILNPDLDSYPAGSPVLNEQCFGDSERGSDGTASVDELQTLEAAGLAHQPGLPLYQVAWTLTPDTPTIATEAVSRLQGNPDAAILHTLADTANDALANFVAANKQYTFNLITVDWYEDSPVVQIAASLSGATP